MKKLFLLCLLILVMGCYVSPPLNVVPDVMTEQDIRDEFYNQLMLRSHTPGDYSWDYMWGRQYYELNWIGNHSRPPHYLYNIPPHVCQQMHNGMQRRWGNTPSHHNRPRSK